MPQTTFDEHVKYKVGDIIVHWAYGLGTIVAIERKNMDGIIKQYYVVQVEVIKLWVPVEDANEGSLRFPTERAQFETLFNILRTPGEQLSDHQYQRKGELRERMKKGLLGGLCRVIRDLTDRSRHHSLNQNDSNVLSRAEKQLLDEWVISLGVERSNAQLELEALLKGDPPGPKAQ
jgi:CarD family transcriptional regulator